MAMVEGAGHIVRCVNPAFRRLMDKPTEQLVGKSFAEVMPAKDECLTLLDRVFCTGKPESHTEQQHSKTSSVFWSFTMWPLFADERPAGVMIQINETAQFHEKTLAMNEALMLGSLRQHELTEAAESLNAQLQTEIGERKQAEQHQLFLTDELAHRGQNLLAVIKSITSRSLSGARSLEEARDVLLQRFQALARSQLALMAGCFEGAPVAEIVRLEFEAFVERVKAAGPMVMLNPRAAQTFALVVHELATNAAKHGALSQAGGEIDIHWSIEGAGAEARFKFQWQECGGPPVVPPTRQGFGHIVLEKAAAQDFGAQPKITFAPEGLIYKIDALRSAVAVGSAGGSDSS
jgi:two-component sensor histidine kinase